MKSHRVFWPLWICALLQSQLASASSSVTTKPQAFTEQQESNLIDMQYVNKILDILVGTDGLRTEINIEDLSAHIDHLTDKLTSIEENDRTKLDELKRHELNRIRKLSEELQKRGHSKKAVRTTVTANARHLDLKDLTKFSIDDLKRLILRANVELSNLKTEEHNKFKEYEMHKQLEFDELLKRLSPEKLKLTLENRQAHYQNHKNAKPIYMPAGKDHLIKVWEEKDLLNKENFNVKTFFHLHDLDGNKLMDEYEFKIILENQMLDLHYDNMERMENLNRMLDYAFSIIDINKDHMIDVEEFVANSKRTGFDDHTYWENIMLQPLFTPQEYKEYSEQHREEINKIIDDGLITLPSSGIVQHQD